MLHLIKEVDGQQCQRIITWAKTLQTYADPRWWCLTRQYAWVHNIPGVKQRFEEVLGITADRIQVNFSTDRHIGAGMHQEEASSTYILNLGHSSFFIGDKRMDKCKRVELTPGQLIRFDAREWHMQIVFPEHWNVQFY